MGGVLAEAERCLAGVPTSEAATKSSFSKYHEVVAVAHKRDGFEQAQRSLAAVLASEVARTWSRRQFSQCLQPEVGGARAKLDTLRRKRNYQFESDGRTTPIQTSKNMICNTIQKNGKTLITEDYFVIIESFRFGMIVTNDFKTLTKFLRYYLICNPAADRA